MPRPEFALREVLKAAAKRAAVERDASRIGLAMVNDIKVRVSQPGRGRAYPRGGGRVHVASAPGDPPAVDTGVYRAAWTHQVDEAGPTVEVAVFADPAHLEANGEPRELPIYLEHGTRRMLPRPHVRPSVQATAPLVPGVVRDGLTDRERAEARRQGGRG